MKAFKKTLCIAAAVATTLLPLGSAMAQDIKSRTIKSVSYTHLTLPTIYSV